MKKFWKIIIGLSLPTTIAATSLLSSCVQKDNVTVSAHNIDATKDSNLYSHTITTWISFITNNNKQKIIQLLSSIANLISNDQNLEFRFSDKAYIDSIPRPVYNNTNPTRGNLLFVIKDYDKQYDINLQNLFIYTSDIFIPPTQSTYTFDQVDLPTIENTNYTDVSDSTWTLVFNSTTNGSGFVIPPTLYVIKAKTLIKSEIANQYKYVIVYDIDPNYKGQISLLSNASAFTSIKVTVNLSPYLNKELKTDFNLGQTEINKAFGNNTTLSSIQAMSEVDIFNKLKLYVDSLQTIQPLRNCVDKNDSTKILGFSKQVSIGNSNELTIKFQTNSDYLETYRYTFVLNFV